MIILLVALFILCVVGIRYNHFHANYLDTSQTNAVKGIMAILIFASHIRQYITLGGGFADQSYRVFLNALGQLSVACFFFYSGYGIMCSFMTKDDYVKMFPRNRIIKTLVHFDLAIFLFFLLNIILKIQYDRFDYLFCWIGWTTIGNSNWFIFDMLMLYIITFVSMEIVVKFGFSDRALVYFITILSFVFFVAMIILKGSDSRWYTTSLCFPFGFWFSLQKKKIDESLDRNGRYIFALILSWIVFCALYYLKHITRSDVPFAFMSCVFCIIVSMITMKISVDNSALQFLGKHSFSIFILQRIPMIILSIFGLAENRYFYTFVCLIVTLVVSIVFDRVTQIIDSRVFSFHK